MKRNKTFPWLIGALILIGSVMALFLASDSQIGRRTTKNDRKPASISSMQAPLIRAHRSPKPSQILAAKSKEELQLGVRLPSVVRSVLIGGKLDSQIKTKPDHKGIYKKIGVYRMPGTSYPIAVEQVLQRSDTGDIKVKGITAMVADHIIVKLNEGRTAAELDRAVKKAGGKIQKHLPYSDLYLVEFPASAGAVGLMVEALLPNSDLIQDAEPDYIRAAR